MKICKRNVIFEIIPCQVCINDSMSFGNGLFVPYLLICVGSSSNNGICFFLAALGFALKLGDRGDIISWSTSHIGMGHIFLCHSYHLCVSIPHWSETIPNVGYKDMDSQRDCTPSEMVVTAINRAITTAASFEIMYGNRFYIVSTFFTG